MERNSSPIKDKVAKKIKTAAKSGKGSSKEASPSKLKGKWANVFSKKSATKDAKSTATQDSGERFKRLPREFFACDTVTQAKKLIGKVIRRNLPDGTILRDRIVETEAY